MRVLAFIGLSILAACGDSGAGENKAAPAAAASLADGQWELASEVTSFDNADSGAPRINTPVGTRATQSICVGAGERPPTAFFSGDGYDCDYGSYYVRNGRVNVTLSCRREGLPGSIEIMADGRFETGTAELRRTIRTTLTGDGDVAIEARVNGRRTGDCPAAPAG